MDGAIANECVLVTEESVASKSSRTGTSALKAAMKFGKLSADKAVDNSADNRVSSNGREIGTAFQDTAESGTVAGAAATAIGGPGKAMSTLKAAFKPLTLKAAFKASKPKASSSGQEAAA